MCGIVGWLGSVNPELIKRVVEESKVRGLHNLGKFELKTAGIYHTRYCTSGKDHQPIIRNNAALVMNGVIHMGTKKEMEKTFEMNLMSDNDAELLLVALTSNKQRSFGQLMNIPVWERASIAALMLKNGKLFAMRNDRRPLWMIEKAGSVLLASTQDIFKRAGAEWKKAKLLEPNRTYVWTI